MCGLFGLVDYHNRLNRMEKNRVLSVLSQESEARGIDATGIAYNSAGRLVIYKRPVRGSEMQYRVPGGAKVVMGHTRLTTQGEAKRNSNNHPFRGSIGGRQFALAHNGVIRNELDLRQTKQLPPTRVKTDSYVALQLLEQQRALNLDSLRSMAEQVEGSFSFTVLDDADRLYLVKGNSPLHVLHFTVQDFYLYASTATILTNAVFLLGLLHVKSSQIPIESGEILRIDQSGRAYEQFDDSHLYRSAFGSFPYAGLWGSGPWSWKPRTDSDDSYLSEIKSVANAFGVTPEEIDQLVGCGIGLDEIEEMLYQHWF